jgi:hypothetical protein
MADMDCQREGPGCEQEAQALRELQGDAWQERVRALMHADQKTMDEILEPDQQKRLRQIVLQAKKNKGSG